jgi:hypothetical protein
LFSDSPISPGATAGVGRLYTSAAVFAGLCFRVACASSASVHTKGPMRTSCGMPEPCSHTGPKSKKALGVHREAAGKGVRFRRGCCQPCCCAGLAKDLLLGSAQLKQV